MTEYFIKPGATNGITYLVHDDGQRVTVINRSNDAKLIEHQRDELRRLESAE